MSPSSPKAAAPLEESTQPVGPHLSNDADTLVSCELIPSGWTLVKGMLLNWRRGRMVSLIVEQSDGSCETFEIPVSRNGRFNELLRLPIGVVRLAVDPTRSPGHFDRAEISLISVGLFRRMTTIFGRVVPSLFELLRSIRYFPEFPRGSIADAPYELYRIAGRNRVLPPTCPYSIWIKRFDKLTLRDRALIRQQIASWREAPYIHVMILADDGERRALETTLESIRRQLYENCRITISMPLDVGECASVSDGADDVTILRKPRKTTWSSLLDGPIEEASARSWIVCLRPGMVLADHALYWLAHEAKQHNDAELIYFDHDSLDSQANRSNPVFKPDWSPELLRSSNYIGFAAAIRASTFLRAGKKLRVDVGRPDNHNLLLDVTACSRKDQIRHIPAILIHQPLDTYRDSTDCHEQSECPVSTHLKRIGVEAKVGRPSPGLYAVWYALPSPPPSVTIIIPTRDGLPHLTACVESVVNTSTYRNYELIIVDNQSREPETLSYLKALSCESGIRVIPFDEPFNYSAINNLAANAATGEVLCLLNNDTEVITPNWMEAMVGHLLQPDVGVVGAKLYYKDGRVQHAGDTVGPGGCADHLHSFLAHDAPGYCNRAILAQDLSSVTGACLMTWKSLFLRLGGFDTENLPVAFNDVDYCLRVREAHYRVVWTPHAELFHHESYSRGADRTAQDEKRSRREVAYMRRRWGHLMHNDPFYNLNLNYARPDFSLAREPKAPKPWR